MKKHLANLLNFFSNYELGDKDAIFILIGLVIIFFSPLLFFGKILLNADSTYLAYPSAYFFHHYFGSPINPFLFSGYPVGVAFEYGYFHPINNLIFYLFNFLLSYHLLLFFDYVGAAVFMFLFARKIQLSIHASLLASIGYTFSQLSMAWLGVLSVANAVFFLPALMYSLLELSRMKKKFILVFGVVLGLAFLGTHYQFVVVGLIGGGIFFLFEVWQNWQNEEKLIANLKPLLYLGLGFIIAFLISIPQTLKSLQFFAESTRESILVYSSASHVDLLKYLIPTFNFPNVTLDEFRPYAGIGTLFFAIITLYFVCKKKIQEKHAIFFSLFFVLTLIMALKYSPFLFIFKHLPLIKYFAVQSRWVYLSNFAFVILAAFGFDFISKNESDFPKEKITRFLKILSICFFAFFALATLAVSFLGKKLILMTQNYFDLHLYQKTIHLPLKYYHDLIEMMARKAFLNVSFANPNVVLCVLSFIALYWLLRLYPRKNLFSNAVILFSAVSLIVSSFLVFKMGDKSLILSQTQLSEFIKSAEKDPYNYRVFSFQILFAQYQKITAVHPEEEKESFIFAKEALIGNLNVFSEVPIVGGYNPLAFRRYQNIVAFLENTTARKTTEEKIPEFLNKLNLLSVLNAKYIVTAYPLESSNLKLVFNEEVTKFHVPLYLYKNEKVLPRFYFPKNISFLAENEEKESFSKVIESETSFNEITFIECDICNPYKNLSSKKGTVKLIQRNNNGFEIETQSDSPEWLVVLEEAVPGWVATVDGKKTQIYYANHAFQGIFVPKGKHLISFDYKLNLLSKDPIF